MEKRQDDMEKSFYLWIRVENDSDPSTGKTCLIASPDATPEEKRAFIEGKGPMPMIYVTELEAEEITKENLEKKTG